MPDYKDLIFFTLTFIIKSLVFDYERGWFIIGLFIGRYIRIETHFCSSEFAIRKTEGIKESRVKYFRFILCVFLPLLRCPSCSQSLLPQSHSGDRDSAFRRNHAGEH